MMKRNLVHSELHESGHHVMNPCGIPLVAPPDGHAVDDSLGSGVNPSGWSGGDTRMEGSQGPCESILSSCSLLFSLE